MNLDNNKSFTFTDSQLVNYPRANLHPTQEKKIIKNIFAVDSRQRDYNLYPNANNYNLPIPDRYKNVTGIELKAAMLPRSEYNVNTSNKYIDFCVGDYISSIRRIPTARITKNGNGTPFTTVPLAAEPLIISPPTLSAGHIAPVQATAVATLNAESFCTNITITNAGAGYSDSSPPTVTLGDYTFELQIGINYTAELREGQYVIGGNPQTTDNTGGTSLQSWVPNNLLNEIESALSYAILSDSNHCYSRQPWTATASGGVPANSTTDYPLLFSARLMSQYPSIDTYSGVRTEPENFETNACKFNRICITNCLIFRSAVLPGASFLDDHLVEYVVKKTDTIPAGGGYILYCHLKNPLKIHPTTTNYWQGLNFALLSYKLAHWELKFATGDHRINNSATLCGYNKKNYVNVTINNAVVVNHTTSTNTTLIPKGISYSGENDYYLFGDPEYVNLSFSPKYGGGSLLDKLNSRVDSQDDTNINQVFACLIFDNVKPAVLQDISSGSSDATIGSLGYTTNTLTSLMNFDNTHQEVKQLTGNSGAHNVSYNEGSGQLKAMKGADFDTKQIIFPTAIPRIAFINIRFTKFSKIGAKGTDNELYDFHGKEHLLLFEITNEY